MFTLNMMFIDIQQKSEDSFIEQVEWASWFLFLRRASEIRAYICCLVHLPLGQRAGEMVSKFFLPTSSLSLRALYLPFHVPVQQLFYTIQLLLLHHVQLLFRSYNTHRD